MTRLVGCWMKQRCIPRKTAVKRRRFARRYTVDNIRLLASVDAAHGDLSGPGVRRILQREFTVFGKPEFENLAGMLDMVTQWQMVGCVETVSENHLVPVLESMLHQFPFRILGFHCDNGSEFINQRVAQMLNKLLVEFTKSRAYRTTDNALVEGKNGAVVRKHIGYGPIGCGHAAVWQKFYTAYFNPYLNYHRPCGFATVVTDRRGKHKRRYRANDYRTPCEKLISLKKWKRLAQLSTLAAASFSTIARSSGPFPSMRTAVPSAYLLAASMMRIARAGNPLYRAASTAFPPRANDAVKPPRGGDRYTMARFPRLRRSARAGRPNSALSSSSVGGSGLPMKAFGSMLHAPHKMFTARAASSATVVNEIVACTIISPFAHRESTGTSVGEKAVLVLNARNR
jgi:hypothetical protein